MEVQEETREWAAHRLALVVGVAAVLAVSAIVGIAWSVGFREEVARLTSPRWPWLLAALGGELVAYLGYIAAYREVARAEDGAELAVPKAAALVAAGFGAFAHAGGFALDRAALQRAGMSEREAGRRVRGLGALEYAALAPATMVAAILVVLWHRNVSTSLTLPWIIGVPVGAVIALTALRLKRAIRSWPVIGKPLAHGLDSLSLVLTLLTSPRHALATLGTVAYWGGDIFCLWAALQAFSANTPPIAPLVVAYSTGYALTRRALPLGGAGIVEALLPFALGWLKVGLVPALAAVIVYRLINLWLPIVPALLGLPAVHRPTAVG